MRAISGRTGAAAAGPAAARARQVARRRDEARIVDQSFVSVSILSGAALRRPYLEKSAQADCVPL
jgi:hypothetical protein